MEQAFDIPRLGRAKTTIHLTSENTKYYRVRTGDTLWDLSKKFGVSVDDIQRWNELAADIHAGEKLVFITKTVTSIFLIC